MATDTSNGSQQNANAELHNILEHDASKGAAVHIFDPDASPQQKAAAAGKQSGQLKSVATHDVGAQFNKGALLLCLFHQVTSPDTISEMPVEINGGGIVPTISVEDADRATKEEQEMSANAPPPPATIVPGQYPSDAAPAIPDWYKIGWRAVVSTDVSSLEEGEEKDKYILHLFLSEQYYGQWYHNAAIMFFVSLCSEPLLFIICVYLCPHIGHICLPFPDTIQFRLGVVNYLVIYLQHVLCDFDGPRPSLRS